MVSGAKFSNIAKNITGFFSWEGPDNPFLLPTDTKNHQKFLRGDRFLRSGYPKAEILQDGPLKPAMNGVKYPMIVLINRFSLRFFHPTSKGLW